ncbi:hypothetical protein SH580_19270 [Coraliomargarita algicola]|uniref:Lipoprotein n=1 Tax=Coraliomargarita algicola TaxID=3092156 RepID=A0ABZ0RJ55_9BACT|nr:hypothetical protein [Coraliomargarita sp. J2-16]WPJ95562.1 hypothetical protein SH580_19270 [Coraliomargarita sp. J2-16]
MKFKFSYVLSRLCLLLCMILSISVCAKERPIWVRAFGVESSIEGLFFETNGEYRELALRAFSPSNPTKIPIDGDSLYLYTKYIDAETGLPMYQRSGSLDVPSASKLLTLAVVPMPAIDAVPQFKLIGFDDNDPAYQENTIRLINYSPYDVAAMFGDQRVLAKSGKTVFQQVDADEKGRVFGVAGRLISSENGYDLETFYQGPIIIMPGRRVTMLVSYSVEALRARGEMLMMDAQGNPRPEFVVAQWMERAPRRPD